MAKSNGFLRSELESLINRYSRENASDTPDFILAEYMMGCLEAFERATKKRDKWYGFSPWKQEDEGGRTRRLKRNAATRRRSFGS